MSTNTATAKLLDEILPRPLPEAQAMAIVIGTVQRLPDPINLCGDLATACRGARDINAASLACEDAGSEVQWRLRHAKARFVDLATKGAQKTAIDAAMAEVARVQLWEEAVTAAYLACEEVKNSGLSILAPAHLREACFYALAAAQAIATSSRRDVRELIAFWFE